MEAGKRGDLRRKYLNLGIGELVAATVFAIVAIFSINPRLPNIQDQISLWSALIPLLAVLVAAGLYWLLARAWVGRTAMPSGTAATYRVLKVALLVLLGCGLVGVVMWWPDNIGVAVFVTAVWGFAVVEYTNYFVVRLAYPLRRWFPIVTEWRTPQLIKDIRTAHR